MTQHRLKIAAIAAAFAAVGALTPLTAAKADGSDCLRWDESDSMRCFDCMKRVWTGTHDEWVNTCAPRYYVPRHGE